MVGFKCLEVDVNNEFGRHGRLWRFSRRASLQGVLECDEFSNYLDCHLKGDYEDEVKTANNFHCISDHWGG